MQRYRLLVLAAGLGSMSLLYCVGDVPTAGTAGDDAGSGNDGTTPQGDSATGDDASPDASSTDGSTTDGNTAKDGGGDGAADAPIDTGPSGVLDPTFANGQKGGGLFNYPNCVAVGLDGRVFVGGNVQNCVSSSSGWDYAIVAFDTGGNIDTTFGTNGRLCIEYSAGSSDTPTVLKVDPSGGNLLIGGESYIVSQNGAFIAAVTPQGSVLWRYRYPVADAGGQPIMGARSLAIDGARVYVGGTDGDNTQTQGFILALQKTTGALDTSFGGGYWVDNGVRSYDGVAVLSPGGPVVGVGATPGSTREFYARRFLANGTPDSTFGASSIAKFRVSTGALADEAFNVHVQSDGKLVLGGATAFTNTSNASATGTVARLLANGTAFDSASFAATATVAGVYQSPVKWGVVPPNSPTNSILQPSGKIILGGSVDRGGTKATDLTLTRVNSDGTLDTAWGTAGFVYSDLDASDGLMSLAVDPTSGKIVALGQDNFTNPTLYRFSQ